MVYNTQQHVPAWINATPVPPQSQSLPLHCQHQQRPLSQHPPSHQSSHHPLYQSSQTFVPSSPGLTPQYPDHQATPLPSTGQYAAGWHNDGRQTQPGAFSPAGQAPPAMVRDDLRSVVGGTPIALLRKESATVICPRCGRVERSKINFVWGRQATIITILFAFFAIYVVWLPFVWHKWHDVEHRCGSCDGFLAVYDRRSKLARTHH